MVKKTRQDRAEDEVDIYTDADVYENAVAIACICTDMRLLSGSCQIASAYGLIEEAELFSSGTYKIVSLPSVLQLLYYKTHMLLFNN